AFHQHELRAAGEELRRTAFVLLDMGVAVTEDRAPGLREDGEREGVGGCAGGNEIDRGLRRREDLADAGANLVHRRILAVGHRIALVRGGECRHDLGRCGGGVVGGEVHYGSSMMWSSQSSSGTSNSGTTQPRTDWPAAWTLSASPVTSGCQSGRGLPSKRSR